jgi:tRNA threonylcarbamoyladenosine biosynthesis protein TsaB
MIFEPQSPQSPPPDAQKLLQADQKLLLAIDTCGNTGSVALGRLSAGAVEILGLIELEGRSYSATLVAAVQQLLRESGIHLRNVAAIVAVNGPGSFTGVRVGLSAVKGLAEPAQIPVVAVSRLRVLAWKASAPCTALDARRHQVFLRIGPAGAIAHELLAGPDELAAITPPPQLIAVCDQTAALLLQSAWPSAELRPTPAPTATDALEMCIAEILARQFIDLALLDAHYLRRSDAEIFREAARA